MVVFDKEAVKEGGAGRENHLEVGKIQIQFGNMITLWASICWSSHARVTSKKSLFSLKSWNAELNLFSKSSHRRQNFCAGAIFRFIFHIQILQSIKSNQASNGNSLSCTFRAELIILTASISLEFDIFSRIPE